MSDYLYINTDEIKYLARNVDCKFGSIKIIHLPTGIIVKVDSECSQLGNKRLAMAELNRVLEERANEGCDSEEYF